MSALVRSPRTAHSLRLLFLTCSPPGKDTSWVGNAHPHLPAALEEGDSVMILLPLRERDLSPEARDAGWERSALLIGKQTGPRAPRIPKLPAAGAPRQASHRAPSRPPSGLARPRVNAPWLEQRLLSKVSPRPRPTPGLIPRNSSTHCTRAQTRRRWCAAGRAVAPPHPWSPAAAPGPRPALAPGPEHISTSLTPRSALGAPRNNARSTSRGKGDLAKDFGQRRRWGHPPHGRVACE